MIKNIILWLVILLLIGCQTIENKHTEKESKLTVFGIKIYKEIK